MTATPGSSPKGSIRILADLTKFGISLTSTLTALSACVLSSGGASWALVPLFGGVFLTACGACALNEYQERGADALMERTRHRPLPAGSVSPASALVLSLALLALGIGLLSFWSGRAAGLLAALAVLWYNGLYTSLKRITAFAVVPGAAIGAIPPAIGWTAGGGTLPDPRLWALCFFFGVWQVPHFWLLLFRHGEDYRRAGLPCLTGTFRQDQLARITFVWILTAAAAALLLPLFHTVGARPVQGMLTAAALWLGWQARKILYARAPEASFKAAFIHINIFALLVIILTSLDPFIAAVMTRRGFPVGRRMASNLGTGCPAHTIRRNYDDGFSTLFGLLIPGRNDGGA